MDWHQAITQLEPYIFRITIPDGFGSGFLLSQSKTTDLCAIATAAHVIDHAHYWEEPIRLYHPKSGKTILLRPGDRAINVSPASDTASLIFKRQDLQLPGETLPLQDKEKFLKPGVEIGWLGFPAIPQAGLCFFSGRISAYLLEPSMYLVDGVAINGVSGGPAFVCPVNTSKLMGVVSAYIPNRATGDVLPGVAVVRDVAEFHDLADRFRSMDEAKAQETPPTEVPVPPQPSAQAGPAARSTRADR
jgi:hypothetical protein